MRESRQLMEAIAHYRWSVFQTANNLHQKTVFVPPFAKTDCGVL
jgi:hypothetical protein